ITKARGTFAACVAYRYNASFIDRKPGTTDMWHKPHLHRPIALIGILGILLLVLAACSPQASSATASSGSAHITPNSTTTTGYGRIHGCPSDTVVSTTPPQAAVIIQKTDINSTVTAHVGDLIEVH